MTENSGDPRAVRHLRPETRQSMPGGDWLTTEEAEAAMRDQRIMVLPEQPDGDDMVYVYQQLAKLREQFPPDRIEKLPKPLWKGAWDGERAGHCDECHGRHVLTNAIHLDYVGHANVTDRLLEIDPLWEWEPMAYTEQGTPLFTDGGLWIRLTICGVTRLGFGDGKSVKEVIGDAIRNAAMRFGVGLDLWAKINLHEERNPGDGATPAQGRRTDTTAPARDARQASGEAGVSAPSRRANQDALDSLEAVCKEHGYSEQYCIDRWASDTDGQHITAAGADEIMAFAAQLIEEATPDPEPGAEGGADGEPMADTADAAGDSGDAADDPAGADGSLPDEQNDGVDTVDATEGVTELDTSDVEKKPGEAF